MNSTPASAKPNVLILGGTTEGSELARLIADDDRIAPVLSLAGRTKSPKLPPIPYRIGGFGGIDGLTRYLREQHIDAVIDATHPFAERMTANAVAAARQTGVPLLRIDRPAWRPVAGDRWTVVADMNAAARALGPTPRRVFLTIGQKDLAAFRAAPQHHYVIRSVDPPAREALPPDCAVISATGPFGLDAERRQLQQERIDVIVTKNSGGMATAAKLTAAREAGIEVIMVERPPTPDVDTVPSAEAALNWLERLAAGPHRTASPTRRSE